MSATRRINGTPYRSPSSHSSAQGSKHPRTTPPSSYLPTTVPASLLSPPEILLLLTYPALLLLGSAFSLLDPSARHAPYSATSQSHPPEFAPNYFALKKNVFNLWFVKVGWFWFTVAWAVWVAVGVGMVKERNSKQPQGRRRVVEIITEEEEEEDEEEAAKSGGEGLVLTPQRLRSLLRWAAVTAWWMLVTQWCFGPPLIDRGFRLTGGTCELMRDPTARAEMTNVQEFVTAATCKVAGGEWKGGHDISGHVFILVLGSAAVGMEVLGALVASRRRGGHGDGDGGGEEEEEEVGLGKWGWGVVVGVVGMSWWMLLMTAAYFHTWFEKSTGLLTAFLGIAVVYLMPRMSTHVRGIFGIPGQ